LNNNLLISLVAFEPLPVRANKLASTVHDGYWLCAVVGTTRTS